VLHDENLADLIDYLTFVYRRFDRKATPTWHGHVGVTLSFVSPVGWTLEHLERIPRITDAAPVLAEALTLAEALGLDVHVPGLCGVPLCTMPGYESYFDEFRGGTPPNLDTRTKLPACEGCHLWDRCSGYWKVYFELHGTDEIGHQVVRPWARSAIEPPPAPALLEALRKLGQSGRTSFEIAQLLNQKRVRTPRGGRWTEENVARLLGEHGIKFREGSAAELLEALQKLVESGRTSLEIAPLLNQKGVRNERGGRWTEENVARLLGEHGIDVREGSTANHDGTPSVSSRK